MKLTRATSYALHAVVFMATQKQNPIIASHLIAKARGIPERFLLKVLKPLVSVRVLSSVKGPNGGYRLAKLPTQITLLEILEAVDGPIRGVVPPGEMMLELGERDERSRDAGTDERGQAPKRAFPGLDRGEPLVEPTRERRAANGEGVPGAV